MSIGALSLSSIFILIVFVLPGFLMEEVVKYKLPTRKKETPKLLLEYLFNSCLNYAVFIWFVYRSLQYVNLDSMSILPTWEFTLSWIGLVFVFPIILGLIKAWFLDKYPTIHPVPTAWDWVFWNKADKAFWVLVTFKDESKVGGLYKPDQNPNGTNSFASSSPPAQDIYIRDVWRVDEDGNFCKKVERTGGIWIAIDEVKTLEFWEE